MHGWTAPGSSARASADDEASDWDLIQAWKAGDRSAGDSLIHRHGPVLERFLQRRGGSIEDLMQETFLQCFRALPRFRGEASFRTFLLATAKNVRRSQDRRDRPFVPADPQQLDAAGHETVEPEAALDRGRHFADLGELLKGLPTDLQQPIWLQYWLGLTSVQIAQRLSSQPSSVRRRQATARKLLGASLKGAPTRRKRD